jgi:predicted RNase H-like HicB family nuclease
MKHILQFIVQKEDEGGYSASAVGYDIITQAETFEELLANIREATSLYLEEETVDAFAKNSPLLINLELPAVYA